MRMSDEVNREMICPSWPIEDKQIFNRKYNRVKVSYVQPCLCTCSAAATDLSRRFCSVTAVVCRQHSHMTWGAFLPPSSVCFFWGKMAAKALLLSMTYMNWYGEVGGQKIQQEWQYTFLNDMTSNDIKAYIADLEGRMHINSIMDSSNLNSLYLWLRGHCF